jgi:CoA-binding domain
MKQHEPNNSVTTEDGLPDDHKESNELPEKVISFQNCSVPVRNPCLPPNKAQYWLVFTDFLAVLIGYVSAFILTFYTNEVLFDRDLPWNDPVYTNHLIQFSLISVCLVLWYENQGHYRNRIPLWIEFKQILNAIILVMLVDAFLRFTFKQDFSRLFLISGWVITAMTIVMGRFVMRAVLKKFDLWHIRVLVIGEVESEASIVEKAIETINLERDLGYVYAGLADPDDQELRQGKTWQQICGQYDADHVIIAMSTSAPQTTNKVIEELLRESISFSLFTVLQSLPSCNLSMHPFINRRAFLVVHDSKLQQFLPRTIKRACDIVFSIIALVLLLPIMLVVSFFVRLDGGPKVDPIVQTNNALV